MAIVSMTLPLVLVAVLSTPYQYSLATASDSPDLECEDCSNGTENRIKLIYPHKSMSSGLIAVCKGGYWRTVCDDQSTFTFSETDASVACFQLGFTRGSGGPGAPGELGCSPPPPSAYIAVNPKAPCKAWYTKLSQCIIGVPIFRGFCSPETAVSVTCEVSLY